MLGRLVSTSGHTAVLLTRTDRRPTNSFNYLEGENGLPNEVKALFAFRQKIEILGEPTRCDLNICQKLRKVSIYTNYWINKKVQ